MLIGTWFRSQPTTDGGTNLEICTFRADGTYLIKFRDISAAGSSKEYGEVGDWGISGDVHFTITSGGLDNGQPFPVDPQEPSHYLAYRVIKLTKNVFTYQTIVTGNIFTLERVGDDFEFPEHGGS